MEPLFTYSWLWHLGQEIVEDIIVWWQVQGKYENAYQFSEIVLKDHVENKYLSQKDGLNIYRVLLTHVLRSWFLDNRRDVFKGREELFCPIVSNGFANLVVKT